MEKRENINLIKNTVARGATDSELALYLHRAKQLGLDPLSGQIHFIKRKVWSPSEDRYVEVGTILIGIDGFRLIAERSGNYDGQDPIIYIVERNGEIKETEYTLPTDRPIAAKAAIYKKGCSRPFTYVAHYREYVQTLNNGKPTKMWEKWSIMLAKCAEAGAIRKGFPEMNLSGVYEYAEIPVASKEEEEYELQPIYTPTFEEKRPMEEEVKKAANKQQIDAIMITARKLGIEENKIKRVIREIDYEKASEIIKRLNRKDTSDFTEKEKEEEIIY